jgi:hypothetical protein
MWPALAEEGELARHANQELPSVDYSADEACGNGRDQPEEAATCSCDHGNSGNGDQHRGNCVGGEPLAVASCSRLAGMTGVSVQDEQSRTGHDGNSEQLRPDR